MAIPFTCPHCGAVADVAETYAGWTGPCVHCGKLISIPASPDTEDACPVGPMPAPPKCRLGCLGWFLILSLVIAGCDMFGVLLARLLPSVQTAREAARMVVCQNQLKQIAAAMKSYHQAYNSFPPAYVVDKNGRPMHSWRVLLLPYLEEESLKSLYKQYRFNEPWDSDNNRKISDLAVDVYQCPSQPDHKNPTTNYMMAIGPHTISDGPHARKALEITDGLHDTIMLVEVADSGTCWTEPRDLRFDQIDFKINGSKRQGISSYHPGGVNAAFCDGSVRFLKDSTNPQLVKAMLTIDGGEQVPAE